MVQTVDKYQIVSLIINLKEQVAGNSVVRALGWRCLRCEGCRDNRDPRWPGSARLFTRRVASAHGVFLTDRLKEKTC